LIEVRIPIQIQQFAQSRIELRLDGPQGNVPSIGRRIRFIEMRARVQEVGTAFRAPSTLGAQRPHHAHQERRTIHYRAIDYLTSTGTGRMDEGAHHPERQ
jgi:hypothetical protein